MYTQLIYRCELCNDALSPRAFQDVVKRVVPTGHVLQKVWYTTSLCTQDLESLSIDCLHQIRIPHGGLPERNEVRNKARICVQFLASDFYPPGSCGATRDCACITRESRYPSHGSRKYSL